MSSLFCMSCGIKLPPLSKYCNSCGDPTSLAPPNARRIARDDEPSSTGKIVKLASDLRKNKHEEEEKEEDNYSPSGEDITVENRTNRAPRRPVNTEPTTFFFANLPPPQPVLDERPPAKKRAAKKAAKKKTATKKTNKR